MIERGQEFVQRLRELGQRTPRAWRQCRYCGSSETSKNGSYTRRVWTPQGRERVRVQRHLCHACGRSYAEESPALVARSWYGRGVRRMAVDQCVHQGSSLRRSAEWVRSLVGHQERWRKWHIWERQREEREHCTLSASTVHRWLVSAGEQAQRGVAGQWDGVANSGQFGADGLWARLRDGAKRVVLSLVDTVTGVIWATQVSAGEESAGDWSGLFLRVQEAGLGWGDLDGVVSDGAAGLLSFLRESLGRVHHQRCIWHFWRSLAADIARLAALAGEEGRDRLRQEVARLLHLIVDAPTYESAEQALGVLRGIPGAEGLAQKVYLLLDRLLYHLLPIHQGLMRIAPEWLWRDFRLRLSRGRNHGSQSRLEQAALVWMVYHNFTPAQERSERKRKYKHPGQSPLQVAGAGPGEISYLDALGV